MYLKKVIQQMRVQLKSILPVFHKAQVENLILMVVGMVYAQSVNLPKVATKMPLKIQIEGRVQRLERLLANNKFEPLEVMKPVAIRVLKQVSRRSRKVRLVMDRSMINDTINVLHVAVVFHGRALPLGWVEVPHEGMSDLALQQELLRWVAGCLPKRVSVSLVADREFHSIWLATWIATSLKWSFGLRIKGNTKIEIDGQMVDASTLAIKGACTWHESVKVTTDKAATYRVNFFTEWVVTEDEPWLIITNFSHPSKVEPAYCRRFGIEEMFSDLKSRGLNLEDTRLTDPKRLLRLLAATAIAYLWIMEVGLTAVANGWRKYIDNRGQASTLSLCQIGLRWIEDRLTQGLVPPRFRFRFHLLPDS